MTKKFLKLFGIFLLSILLAKFIYSQGWYQINITNSQSTATPAPFQQDIAICNSNPNLPSNFAYVNNATLFNEINSNGSNVYFATTIGDTPNLYSWYEGQENFNGVYCDVWWVNISNGIPANSNITIYMYIGSSGANYYSQYYPYVGEAPQLSSTYGQYDNGNYVFNYYWNFNGTTLPGGFTSNNFCGGSFTATITVNNGLTYSAGSYGCQVLYYSTSTFSPPIVFEVYAESTSPTTVGAGGSEVGMGISSGTSFSGTNFWLSRIDYGSNPYNIWNYWISSSATSTNDQMALNTFYVFGVASSGSSSIVYAYGSGVYYYNISTATFPSSFYILPVDIDNNAVQVTYWTRIRAYPPNGVMPSFSIQGPLLLTSTISVNTSTNFQFNVSITDPISEYANYTVYLNGSILTTNNVSITAGQTLTIPYTYQYLFNQSGTYNLTIIAYGQSSGMTAIATDIFVIQLDQLNVSMSPIPYTYNNINYTNLYNTNLNINYYCMRPNNTLIIYDNVTNQTLQFNLSCNYIETPENLFVNLTPYVQNNTLNYINGSLTYGTQSFGNMSFEPLWDTVVVNLTIYLPQILIYTAPLGMNYTVIEKDILPNVTCNTSFYDNNTLIANNQSVLTNGSITYSWVISQTSTHNFNWSITCIDPVNVTTSFTYSTGPYYYNEFNMYMEDSGDIPSNVTYSLTLECVNNIVQYSNANMNTYTLYLWTNNQCNFVQISQQISGITFDEGFNTNLLSNYGFQWPICLINTSLAYFDNPLIGSQPYQDTLIAVENPQTGCYLEGSYLYLYSSNVYYAPVPMRDGALYVIRANSTYLATIEGQQSQAISIDNLIAQIFSQNNQSMTEIVTYPIINVTNISANVYQVTVTAPTEVSSVNISIFYNNTFHQNYILNSINSNNFTVLLNSLPANYTFNSTNYMLITLEYENGVIQQLYYPSTVLSNRITLPSFMVYLIAILILYAWTRAFSYYQRLIVAGFGLALFIVLIAIATLQTTAPLVLTAGIFFFFILDVAYSEFISKFMGEHPLLQPLSFLMRLFMIITFVTNLVGLFFGPYGIYNLNLPNLNKYMNQVNNTITSLNGTITQMLSNPFNFIFDFIGLAIDVIYAISLAIQGVAVFVSLILTPVTVLLGPTATVIANAITSIVYYGSIIAILVYLALLVFAAAGLKPF